MDGCIRYLKSMYISRTKHWEFNMKKAHHYIKALVQVVKGKNETIRIS